MSSPISSNTNLKKYQVHPLPIGSGNSNTMRQLQNTNTELALLQSQSTINAKYDPPVPQQVTKQKIIEQFNNRYDTIIALNVIAILFILYGCVSK